MACRTQAAADSSRSLRALLDLYVTQRGLPGALAAISYHDEPLAWLTSGTLALGSRVPVDENSLRRIYSMTKPVTGFAAMLLIEDGGRAFAYARTLLNEAPVVFAANALRIIEVVFSTHFIGTEATLILHDSSFHGRSRVSR
ncbi:MAG: serine hydrolase [Gammaproteobacteria bacterium]